MSAIAGWVDFDRDLTRERSSVRAMTATLAQLGPDGEGLWASPRAALGHRRLDTVNSGDDQQPIPAEYDGRQLAVLAYAGLVSNSAELRAELSAHGQVFRTSGDAEVILAAYLQWGAQFPGHLVGMYAIAIWDQRTEELLLARDRMGNKPLFYQPAGRGMLFASQAKAILAHPLVTAAVDIDGLREMLGYVGPPAATPYREMAAVPPGHVVRFSRNGIRTERYWALEAQPHTDDLQTTVATIRQLLENAVASQLAGCASPGFMLSGGLDSSVVTALADRLLTQRGAGPARTFTVSFMDDADGFRPDEIRATPDAPFVADLVRDIGAAHLDLVVNAAQVMDPAARAATLCGWDMPTVFGDMNTAFYLLCREISQHVNATLMGETADALFGGFGWIRDPDIVGADNFPWVALAQRYGSHSGLGLNLLARDLLKQLDMPAYSQDTYHQALAEVPHVPDVSADERRMREITYIHLTRWLKPLIAHDESLSSAVGLQVRMPYTDHRLVQYVFNAPWAMKTFDGREKSLLRAAAADILPRSILDRTKSPFPVSQDNAYARALLSEFAELVADPDAPGRELIDDEAAAQTLQNPAALAANWVGRTNVELVLQINLWLQRYGVRLYL